MESLGNDVVRAQTHLNLVALPHVLVLGDAVGDDDGLEVRVVDPGEGRPAEDAVRQDGVDLLRAGLHQLVRGRADGAAGVGHVVHQDGNAALHVAHQHHRRHLVGLLALLVDQRKLGVQPATTEGMKNTSN
jgi:hypothetical protein